MKVISWIVYVPLQCIALPICIVGGCLVAYRQMLVSKRLGVSQTAIEVFNARWTLHIFRLRDDPGAARLGPVLPNTSTLGLFLALFPLWVKANIAGESAIYPRRVKPGFETIRDFVTARTVYFDRLLERQLPQVEQFVLMGAGMDTRPYGALDVRGVKVFELDQPSTQRVKRACLHRAALNADHVTFTPIDFAHDELFERLASNRFDCHQRTLFLWEGVTLYLSEAAVRDTLSKIQANSPAGSVLLADFYSDRVITHMRSQLARKILQYTNEPIKFSLNLDRHWENTLRIFVESTGFTLGETFFMGTHSDKGPFMVVAELIV